MARLFILIKRKGSKRYLGAIPSKKGVSKVKLKRVLRKELRAGFTAVVVTPQQLKRIILRQKPKRLRRIKRRHIKRIKRRSRKKKK